MNNPPIPIGSTTSTRRQPSSVDDDGIDPREIDKVLTEVASLAGRWNIFRNFLSERLKV